MKFRIRIILTVLAVAVLPMILINRYALAFFHHFTKEALENSMVHSAKLTASVFQADMVAADRETILTAHALETESRIRFFDAEQTLLFDTGESPGLEIGENTDVKTALQTGGYAARWQLTQDRSRLYYFSAWPQIDPVTGEVEGVAQVIRHTAPITKAIMNMKAHQTRATWWAAATSVLLSVLFSILLTLRLRGLRHAATHYAQTGDAAGFEMKGKDEIADLAAEFRTMAMELEKRQAYNRNFVLTTLHELKTPLTAIQGAAELMRERPDLPATDRMKFAGNIAFQSERLSRLVEELRALTSLDVDIPGEPMQLMQVGLLIQNIIDRIRPAFNCKINLIGADNQVMARVLPRRIEQVMVNLLENAERHSHENEEVCVELSEVEGHARICVMDRGPGFASENIDRVFDRFFTTVPKGETLNQGRGLGLAVVKRIIEAHHGQVFAVNRDEGGACVGFELPIIHT
ncbi:MAG: hypothetical protein JJU29_05000 [Verrucomicrobia bacterium]|nr:hypothetical protein [Verrucomicrobiota bacterium]MCH8511298.1 hypothetical protein [Kiritimatiellia bacterium]